MVKSSYNDQMTIWRNSISIVICQKCISLYFHLIDSLQKVSPASNISRSSEEERYSDYAKQTNRAKTCPLLVRNFSLKGLAPRRKVTTDFVRNRKGQTPRYRQRKDRHARRMLTTWSKMVAILEQMKKLYSPSYTN